MGKKFKIVTAVFLVIALSIGGVLGYYDAKLEASVTPKGNLSKVDVGDDVKFDKDVVNILLVGSDRRSDETESGRSDSSMIATINMKTKELKLTSLMRDMYVDIPGHGRDKLNSAYSYGGVDLLYKTIAQNFDIKIDKYCVVDFSTFEINLEEKEANYLNTTNYISKKKYRNVKAGKQTLNGNQALGYSRVRYVSNSRYGDGEFGRTGRQRAVLEATYKKIIKQNPMKILDIGFSALDDVSTDMNASYIKGLVMSVVQFGVPKVQQMRIPIEGTYMQGRAQNRMFVFFVNFDANKAAMEHFIFSKGKNQDFATKYGGYQNVETYGYSAKPDSEDAVDSSPGSYKR